jgi:hypothetical protein
LQGQPPPRHAPVCPPDPPAVVRGVDESAAPWFKGPVGAEAREVYRIVHPVADGAAEMERQRDDLARELREATERLAEEERTPVIDERERRQASRAERHR